MCMYVFSRKPPRLLEVSGALCHSHIDIVLCEIFRLYCLALFVPGYSLFVFRFMIVLPFFAVWIYKYRATDCKSVVPGSNPANHTSKLCQSLGWLPPGMAKYHMLSPEGRQRYKVHKNPKILSEKSSVLHVLVYAGTVHAQGTKKPTTTVGHVGSMYLYVWNCHLYYSFHRTHWK
jgi:hypothetical protein